ncbi:MAG: Rha family transcriptional regulator [Candidatus Competibacter denitrificans]
MSSSALVSIKDGKPVTTSLMVAESFNKNHRDVLRSIDSLTESPAYLERNQRNFARVDYLDAKGERRPMFEMDRQGFEILAMGFTGEEALRWKFQYSDAFAAMEQSLKSPPSHPHDPIAAQLADFLKGKVLVDYGALAVFARLTRAGWAKIAEGQALLEEAEQRGLELEKQCGQPLIKFDIPQDRLARYQAMPPKATAPASRKSNPLPPLPAVSLSKDPATRILELITQAGPTGITLSELHKKSRSPALPRPRRHQILQDLLAQGAIVAQREPARDGGNRHITRLAVT